LVVAAADGRAVNGSETANSDPMSSILLLVPLTRMRPESFLRHYPDLMFGSNRVAKLTTRETDRYAA
jgi:hypothetical protein